VRTVTVLGGTGIFGGRVARALAATEGLAVRVAARDRARGEAFAREIGARFVPVDVSDPGSLDGALEGSDLVVHAAGPFQGRDYRVARACLAHGVSYLDLADAREFVVGIGALDDEARARGVFVGSGASSIPTVTYALVKEVEPDFVAIDEIDLALSPGNQNPRGVATLAAVLASLAAPMRVWIDGAWRTRRGWGDRARLELPPHVGARVVRNVPAPDHDLFPPAFRARTVRFRAGVELSRFHAALGALAALRRLHLVPRPDRFAGTALRLSLRSYARGSKNGALAAWVRGRDRRGRPIARGIALVTADDGPATPSAPAILLARKHLLGGGLAPGARACCGLLTLAELLAHLEPLGIWCARTDERGCWSPPPV
jgi:saccharopine dehydrogenase-like NADP-dependent oxidoreductase